MSALGSLVVKLALEYAQFTQGLNKTEQEALNNAEKVQKAYDKMAGAVDERFQSLKSSIAGAVAGAISVAGLIAVGQKIREETINAEKEQAQLAAALKSTGEAAGWSQDQLNDMASAMNKVTTYSAGEINQAQARLLAYVNITGEQVPRAVRAAMDMGTRLEMNLNQSMETVAKALDKPSTGMQSLQRQGFKFTESQIEMAKALENSGRLADAQAIVFAELESSYGGAAEAARDTLGGALTAVSNTINDLLTADSASVPALRNSVEELNRLLSSDESKAAFGFYVQLMVSTATAAGKLAVALAELRTGGLGSLLGHATADNAGSELVSIEGKLNKLRADASAVDPSKGFTNKLNDFVFGDYGDLQRQIGVLENQREVLLRTVNASEGLGKSYEDLAADNDVLVASLAGTTEQLGRQGVIAGQTDAYLKKYGTSAQKAAIEIAEFKAKLGDAFTPEMEAKIRASYAKQDEGAKSAAQSAKQLQAAYDSTAKTLDEKIASQRLELSTSEKLKDSAKLRIKYEQDLKGSLSGLNEASRASIELRLKTIETLEDEIEAQQRLAKMAEEERAFRKQWWADQAKSVDELLSGNKAQREEIELIGLSAEQQAQVLRLREEAILLSKEQQLAEMQLAEDANQHMSQQRINLEQEIELRRERLALTSVNASRVVSAAATAASVEEWQQGVAQIGQSLSDQLMEGGRSFGDYLKNLARTLVFKPVIQWAVQGTGAEAFNAMGLPGNAMMGIKTSGGMTNSLLNNTGLLGSGAQALWGLSAGASASSLAAANAVGLAGGDALGTLIAANGQWAGVATGAASTAGSLMSAIGAAAPWVAGGLALYSLMDGVFDHKSTGEYGGTGYYSAATGSATTTAGGAYGTGFGGVKGGNDQILSQMAGLSQSVVQSLDATAKSFGQKVGYEVAASFASDFGDEATWGGLKIALQGQSLVNWNDNRQSRWAPKEFASGEEGYKQYLNAVALDVKMALQGMDLPGWANQLVSAAGDLDSINAALQQIGNVKALFEQLGQSMQMFKGISGELQTQLLNAFGSMDALSSGVGDFYEGFYSEQERMTILSGNLRDTLSGLDLSLDPAMGEQAKAQFKAAVEGAMAAGQAELAAKLLAMSGAFASTADYAQTIIEQLANDAAQAAQQSAETAARNSAKEADLQIQLLRAQGRETEAVALERQREIEAMAAFGPAAQALQQQIWAVTDAASSAVGGLSGSFAAFTSLAGTAAGYGDASGLKDYLNMLTGSYGSALGITGQQAILEAIAKTEQALDSAGASASALERAAITARQSALQEELRTAQNLLRVASSLGDYVESLYAGEQSGLNDFERLSVLGGQYESLLAAARTGDSDAMGKLQGVSGDYLKLAQQLSGSQSDYSVLSGRIAAELGALSATSKASASAAETLAQQQIAVLDKQLSSLTAVSTTTQDLTQQLLHSAQQQFEQDLQNATQQLIATDSIAAGLAQLPPELAAILASSLSSALNPALSAIASAVANGAKQSSIGALTGAVSTGKITVDLANKLAGGATGSTSGAYKNAIESTGMSEGQFYGLLANNAKPWISSGNGAGMAADMLEYGVSMTDAAKALGMSTGDVAAWLLEHGATKLPSLAVGTNWLPDDMVIQAHQGERVIPHADNRALIAALHAPRAADTSRLEALVESLTVEVRRLQDLVGEGNTHGRQSATVLTRVTNNGNAMVMEEL